MIARLAQRLRSAGWNVSVRALLSEQNTPRKIARRKRAAASVGESTCRLSRASASRRDEKAASRISIACFTFLQVAFLLLLYAPAFAALLFTISFLEFGEFLSSANVLEFIFVGFVFFLVVFASPFAALLWVMLIKLLLSGHVYRSGVTPGVYPKWSWMHLRVWCVERVQNTVLTSLRTFYRSAPLMAFALRRLGATVGQNVQCAKDVIISGPVDLISIGDNVAIQTAANIHSARWDGHNLLVGPIVLESDCKIGMRAGVANDVIIGRNSWITPFSVVLHDVGPDELWEGSPARATGRHVKLKRASRACQPTLPIWLLELINVLMQISLFLLLSVLPGAVIVWAFRDLAPIGEIDPLSSYFTVDAGRARVDNITQGFAEPALPLLFGQLALFTFVVSWVAIVATSLLSCVFIRLTSTRPGIYGTQGLRAALLMYRIDLFNQIQRLWTWSIVGQYLRALAGLRFSRFGASECDVMVNLVPEVAFADSRVFWSHGSFTNVLDYGAEYVTLRRIDMPPNFFSGNNCVAEYGRFPDNFLIGVSTPCSEILYRQQLRSRPSSPVSVAGNPPLQFASAPLDGDGFSRKPPSFVLFLGRVLLHDILSVGVVRVVAIPVFAFFFISLLRGDFDPISAGALALALTEATLLGLAVLVKKAIVGNEWGREHKTSFWSWRHFTYFLAQDCFFAWCRLPLSFVAGTVLANRVLRWLGCRIGQGTIINDPMQCSDWNAVDFGSDCVVGGYLQLHTFEHMVLRVKQARIGDGATVAFGATVMSGAVIEGNTTVRPLSMVLKEMNLATAVYEGSPVVEVSASSVATRF